MRRRRSRLRPHGVSAEVVLDLGDPIDAEAFDAELDAAPSAADDGRPVAGASTAGPVTPGPATPEQPAAAGPAAERVGPGPAARVATRARPRRRWALAVAGALVLLLGGMAAVDVVAERRLAARMAEAPGGIRPLDGPPAELWSVPISDHSYAVLPGLLVVPQDGRLVAYDLDDGTEQWRTEAVGTVVCDGPSWRELPGARPSVEDRLVCLEIDPVASGPYLPWSDVSPRRVVVVAADGTVTSGRDLTEADGRVTLGPAGTVVRTERVGDALPPPGVEIDPVTGEITGMVGLLDGSDLLVTVEDALTGESLWTDTLPFRATEEPWPCIHWDDDGEDPALDVDLASATRQESLLEVWGCGVSATFDVNGTRLDDPAAPYDQVWGMVGDDVLRMGWGPDGMEASEVVGADGTLRWSSQDEILVPLARDGQGATVVPVHEDGFGLRALDRDGEELWTAVDFPSVSVVLAHVDDLIVYVASRRWTVAVDAATGEQRWVSESSLSGLQPTHGFTDGRSIVVVGTDWGSRTAMHALDLHDGAELWSTELTSGWGDVRVVEGRLFRVSDAEITRIG